MIEISKVSTQPDLAEFIKVPRLLYKSEVNYSPPLDFERKELLDPKKSSFFHDGEACYFLAKRRGDVVGRISAQIDNRFRGLPGNSDVGFFGCLDAIDDREVVTTLLQAARHWLLDHKIVHMQGPHLLTLNTEPGLMVHGQDRPAMVMAPWHPAYLEDHLTALGFQPVRDLNYYLIDPKRVTRDGAISRLDLADRVPGLSIRSLRLNDLQREAEIACMLYNDAWRDNWGFVPLKVDDLVSFLKTLKPLMHEDAGIFVERDGEPIACTIAIPNVADLLSDLDGRPSPLGWAKLLFRITRRSYKSFRIILMGISQAHRRSVLGSLVLAAMVAELTQRSERHDLDYVEAGWVLDNNTPLIKLLETYKMTISRTYRVFERATQEAFL